VRLCLLWLALLLALPWGAHADDPRAAASLDWESMPATAGTEPPADAPPPLDLSLDSTRSAGPGSPTIPPVAPLAKASRADRTVSGPFSVGVDIKTQRNLANPAVRATLDQDTTQTLTDKVEGVVRHSTFGLTGTYRF
jgi:hypothetical protein